MTKGETKVGICKTKENSTTAKKEPQNKKDHLLNENRTYFRLGKRGNEGERKVVKS